MKSTRSRDLAQAWRTLLLLIIVGTSHAIAALRRPSSVSMGWRAFTVESKSESRTRCTAHPAVQIGTWAPCRLRNRAKFFGDLVGKGIASAWCACVQR